MSEFESEKPEYMMTFHCVDCGTKFREDESDWLSLCQECGEVEEDSEREVYQQIKRDGIVLTDEEIKEILRM